MKTKYKIKPNFFFIIFAIIIGAALIREIDFENRSVEKPLLVAIYAITFIMCIVWMIKKR